MQWDGIGLDSMQKMEIFIYKCPPEQKQGLFSFSRISTIVRNSCRIPFELHQLKKTSFKCKLNNVLLKILETEEMNFDMR